MSNRSKNSIVFLTALIFSLVAMEYGLRFFEQIDYSFYPVHVSANGYILHKANLNKRVFNAESQKKVWVKTNDEGFVGDTVLVEKASSTLRIAVLGDSFVEALQVDENKNFVSQLQAYLQGTSTIAQLHQYTTIEVLNFGVQGVGTADALLYYEQFAKKYNPDIVVLAFYEGNDIFDNILYLPARTELLTQDDISHVTQAKAKELLSVSWRQTFFKKSALVRIVSKILKSNKIIHNFAVKIGLQKNEMVRYTANGIPEDFAFYQTTLTEPYASQLIFSADLISRLAARVSSDKHAFLVMYIPSGAMIREPSATLVNVPIATYTLNGVFTNLHSAVASSTPFIDFYPIFYALDDTDTNPLYFNQTSHFTERAHTLVAKKLGDYILQTFNKQ